VDAKKAWASGAQASWHFACAEHLAEEHLETSPAVHLLPPVVAVAVVAPLLLEEERYQVDLVVPCHHPLLQDRTSS